jgi:hypothetical protein
MWLEAGVLEGDEWHETDEGTPQGAGISPLLANIFLHYVLVSGSTNGAVGMHAVGYRSCDMPTTG